MSSTKTSMATFHKRKAGGHHARLAGTLWRHKKAEEAGDAALGLWTRMLSHCADMGSPVLSKHSIAALLAGDKNGQRKLRALVDAGLLDEVEGGYAPHDWHDHNRESRADDGHTLTASVSEREENVSGTRGERESHVSEREENVSVQSEGKQTLTDDESTMETSDKSGTLPALRDLKRREENTSTSSPRSRVSDPVFVHWVSTMAMDAGRVKLNAKRREKLRARRAEGYTDEQLCQAIDGCRLSPFHMGQNDRSEVYNDLATILRDGTTVEKHIGRLGGPGTARPASAQLRPDRPRNTGMMGGLP